MINYIWAIMIVVGILYASLTGNLDAVTIGAIQEAKAAVSLCITLVGVYSYVDRINESCRKSRND